MTAKYLIAILPPGKIQEEVLKLKGYFRDQYESKGALNAPAHITMHMPFDWKVTKEEELIDSLSSFASKQRSFTVELPGYGAFEPRVIFIDVQMNTDLEECQKSLQRFCKTELNIFNALYREQAFHPHITIAFRDLKKKQFAEGWEEFKIQPYQDKFDCRELSLLKHDGKFWQPFKILPFAN